MRQSRIVPDHCRVEVLVGYDAIIVDVEGAKTGDRLLYFRLCQLTKRARKATIVLPPGLVVLQYPFGHRAVRASSCSTPGTEPSAPSWCPTAFFRGGNAGSKGSLREQLINTCTAPRGLQTPMEYRDSLRKAIESRNGHTLIPRISLRPSEVRSMTLTQTSP